MSGALQIDGLRKSFGKNAVLNGIDLTVNEHEVVCLIGASGSGKSTLLRCVNLLEPVDAGRIVVDGEEITRRSVDANRIRRRIGIVFQAFNLFPHMDVLANVTLAPRLALGLRKREAEARAEELLGRFGLNQVAVQRKLHCGSRDPRPVEFRVAVGLDRVGVRERKGVTGTAVKRLPEVNDLPPPFFPVPPRPVLPNFPIKCRLQGVLDRQGTPLDEKSMGERRGHRHPREGVDELRLFLGIDVRQ